MFHRRPVPRARTSAWRPAWPRALDFRVLPGPWCAERREAKTRNDAARKMRRRVELQEGARRRDENNEEDRRTRRPASDARGESQRKGGERGIVVPQRTTGVTGRALVRHRHGMASVPSVQVSASASDGLRPVRRRRRCCCCCGPRVVARTRAHTLVARQGGTPAGLAREDDAGALLAADAGGSADLGAVDALARRGAPAARVERFGSVDTLVCEGHKRVSSRISN